MNDINFVGDEIEDNFKNVPYHLGDVQYVFITGGVNYNNISSILDDISNVDVNVYETYLI